MTQWKRKKILKNAIIINNGKILDDKIIKFQKRDLKDYDIDKVY